MWWVPSKTSLLVRHGSHAYGTNVPESDEDFKGIVVPTKEYFLGHYKRFEQAELKSPDAVVYDIRKFFSLAADCNPNIIEVLYVDDVDRLVVDPIGEEILSHRDEFLSKKIKYTFTGYAVSQLKRIKTHRRWIMSPPRQPPTRADLGLPERTTIPTDQLQAVAAVVQKELDKSQFDFVDSLDESQKIGLMRVVSETLAELKITSDQQWSWSAAARRVGLDDNFIWIAQLEREYSAAKKEWDQFQNWKKTRNPVRAALEEKFGYDTKHALHLVRLIRMCREIISTGRVVVKRPDREELLDIRRGLWTYDELIEFAEREEKEIDDLCSVSNVLPSRPNRKKLDDLCVSLVEKSLRGD